MLLDVTGTLERLEVILDRVAVCAGDCDSIGYGDPSTLTAQFENLYREFGQFAKQESLALQLFSSRAFCCCNDLRKKLSHGCQFGASVRIVLCVSRKLP